MIKHHPTSRRSARRRTLWAAAGLGLLMTLSACGGEETPAPPKLSTTEHNKADVAFATGMIPHHAQAMSMVDLTEDRKLDPEGQELANQIGACRETVSRTVSELVRQGLLTPRGRSLLVSPRLVEGAA